MFTINEIERQARVKLLDTYEDNYRFQPTEIFDAMRDGLRMIRNVRPESKYVKGLLTDEMLLVNGVETDFTVPASFPATIGGTTYTLDQFRAFTVNMENRWMESLVYYVIHQMYLKDDTDTANANLASAYYSKFNESVRS
ncbi:MAG: DUF6682 family protein [Kiritimatiellia bacterium]